MLETLIQIRDDMTASYWEVGDIVNSIAVNAIANNLHADRMKIYQAVGMVIGKSQRTIRQYSATSTFYPKEIREKYGVLAYTHFVVASQVDGGVRWEEILESALDFIDLYGIPPSIEKLHWLAKPPQEQATEVIDVPTFIQEDVPEIMKIEPVAVDYKIELARIMHRLPAIIEGIKSYENISQDTITRCAETTARIYVLITELTEMLDGKVTV